MFRDSLITVPVHGMFDYHTDTRTTVTMLECAAFEFGYEGIYGVPCD